MIGGLFVKRKLLIMMLLLVVATPLLSSHVSANGPSPFQHVDLEGNISKVGDNEIIKSGNVFLALLYVGAGLIISGLFIVGCILLAFSGASSGRRTSGFICLAFSVMAGYFLYKAGAIDTILGTITSAS